jgi:hypothetical protein
MKSKQRSLWRSLDVLLPPGLMHRHIYKLLASHRLTDIRRLSIPCITLHPANPFGLYIKEGLTGWLSACTPVFELSLAPVR